MRTSAATIPVFVLLDMKEADVNVSKTKHNKKANFNQIVISVILRSSV